MSYRDKYLKYKIKYNILLNKYNQTGGYYLSDINPTKEGNDSLLTIILKFINSIDPSDKTLIETILNNDPRIDILANVTKLITFFESPQYIELYDKLFSLYTNMTEYSKKIITSETMIDMEVSKYPYHINIGALILINFLIELECFCLMYSLTKYNVLLPNLFKKNNQLKAINWVKDRSRDISYKVINSNLSDMFTTLTNKLDRYFDSFMDEFITLILRKFFGTINEIDDIKKIILNIKPGESEYSHIHIDWKNKLIKTIILKDPRIYNYKCANTIIKQLIHEVLYNFNSKIPYIPEGNGFFSFMYLVDSRMKPDDNYGSCITYSIVEMYIMSRLHIDMKNIKLELESHDPYIMHSVWKFTQYKLQEELRDPINKKERSISHWTSSYFNTDTIKMREAFPDKHGNGDIIKTFNFMENKKQIFKALNYCIYDTFIEYITINYNDKDYSMNLDSITRINLFYIRRIDFWERKCSTIAPDIPSLIYDKIKVPFIFGFRYFINTVKRHIQPFYTSYDERTNIIINTEYENFIKTHIPIEINVNYKIRMGFLQGILETHSINFTNNEIINQSRLVTTGKIIKYTLKYTLNNI